jgi:hypothetical protein
MIVGSIDGVGISYPVATVARTVIATAKAMTTSAVVSIVQRTDRRSRELVSPPRLVSTRDPLLKERRNRHPARCR